MLVISQLRNKFRKGRDAAEEVIWFMILLKFSLMYSNKKGNKCDQVLYKVV